MKLTYTIELDFAEPVDDQRESLSDWLMQAAFDQVGCDLAGQRVQYVSIWPHDNALPSDAIQSDERLDIPPETCPTCGIQQFSVSARS